MSEPRLMSFQPNNINKLVERIMLIDFSNISEVKELKRKLIEETTNNLNFHVNLHSICLEYHDCQEYESRNKFGRKMLGILNEIIEELENEE